MPSARSPSTGPRRAYRSTGWRVGYLRRAQGIHGADGGDPSRPAICAPAVSQHAALGRFHRLERLASRKCPPPLRRAPQGSCARRSTSGPTDTARPMALLRLCRRSSDQDERVRRTSASGCLRKGAGDDVPGRSSATPLRLVRISLLQPIAKVREAANRMEKSVSQPYRCQARQRLTAP